MITLDQLWQAYWHYKDEYEKHNEIKNEAWKNLSIIRDMIGNALLVNGTKSVKTDSGTIFTRTVMDTKVPSQHKFLNFVIDKGEYRLLTVKANESEVKKYMDAGKGQPDGVEVQQRMFYVINAPKIALPKATNRGK